MSSDYGCNRRRTYAGTKLSKSLSDSLPLVLPSGDGLERTDRTRKIYGKRSSWMYRKFKRHFCAAPLATRLRRRLPLAHGSCGPPGVPRQPAGAARGQAAHAFGWCWTGAAGWGRVAPQGCSEGEDLGQGDVARLEGRFSLRLARVRAPVQGYGSLFDH